MKNKFFYIGLFLAALGIWSCGGGGGGGTGAGNQSVLRVVNASTDASVLDVTVDGELLFTGLMPGQASIFESVKVGAHLVSFNQNVGGQVVLEVENEFAYVIPYTIIAVGAGNPLAPIVAVNDRSDTAASQFRIRAINASASSGAIDVRLEAGIVGRESTSTGTPTESLTPPPLMTPVALITPTIGVTPTVAVTPTIVSTISAEPSNLVVANNLEFQGVSDYVSNLKGDYRIIIESNGTVLAKTGVISFSGGQINSIVLIGTSSAGVEILRLDDKP